LIPVELAPQVRPSLRAMTDRGTPPPRCDEGLGQGETRTSDRYQWTEDGRSILAEEVKNEIYDGATPYTTYVRGVIVEGDRGVLLTGRDDSALVIEG